MNQQIFQLVKSMKAVLISPLIILIVVASDVHSQPQKPYVSASPDGSIRIEVLIGTEITYSVDVDGRKVLKPSSISMTIENKGVLGQNPHVIKVSKDTIKEQIIPVIPEKNAFIDDHFHEMTIEFKNDFSLVFRIYNNGVAYCFKTNLSNNLKVVSETASFNFAGSNHVYYPEEDGFISHNERTYLYLLMDTVSAGRLASLPVLIETDGPKVLIAESSLRDYPGMWLKTGDSNSLQGTFPHYALESKPLPDSDRNVPVTQYADFLAKTKGNHSYPWRIFIIARQDADLITNQLVFQLAEPLHLKDPSWIRPGKVAWDWWNANNVFGVDFRAGVNTETYKYYIDFASKYGIEYIILDEGWYKLGDVLDVVPEMNVEELIAYGMKKNVGIILWVVWKTLDDQLEEALDQFEKWGAAGIKVDFMQRDDQDIVNFYWNIAREAAERNMLVDFHGAYKPAGMRRAYPNVITREGVKGLEHNKWSQDITPRHNLLLPFIRMVPGPMDYTPGAMVNAQPGNFRVSHYRPMSMGTRAHQAAMYVIYESPLQMMADSPSNYEKESESTQFIAKIPTTWDETRVLEARIGEYLILARKRGRDWYIGAMTNEEAREFTLELSFLENGNYIAEIMADGINADRYGSDYRRINRSLSKDDEIKIKLAPGGGWAAIIKHQ